MRKRKSKAVTKPIIELTNPSYVKFEKTKHVVCHYTHICNKFGAMPNEQCIKAECPFATYSEFEIETTAKGYRRTINRGSFVDC